MSELSNIKTLEELFEYWKTKQSNDSGKETCNSEMVMWLQRILFTKMVL